MHIFKRHRKYILKLRYKLWKMPAARDRTLPNPALSLTFDNTELCQRFRPRVQVEARASYN